jgi:RimJ/RimL family protein N-acetyltransferase/8-oxo-dGTP pyrophosphatase MutT (NUDIX family)
VSVPAPKPALQDGDVVLRRRDGAEASNTVTFQVEHRGRGAGTVQIKSLAGGIGELSWAVSPEHRGQDLAARAVRLTIRYAFDELGLHRVAAYSDPGDLALLQTAGRVGLRREGLVRAVHMAGGDSSGQQEVERHDRVQLARLASDPEPTTRDGFIGVLNAGLPTKRVIAQGLIRNNANEILLCELTYKQEWDLPGGVVDPHESPAQAVIREIREELDVEMAPVSLVAVNWLPSWRGWDDAMLCVFDLGVDDQVIARARLEPRELLALHWCTLQDVERRAAPYVTRMLRRLLPQGEDTAYLEDGSDPGW